MFSNAGLTVGRALSLGFALLLGGCGEKPPVLIGYLGGVSGRVADLGIAGRNGAQLAVEAVNAQGGIDGRKVELLIRDDEQNADLARRRFVELADAKVAAVVGPMTSSMCAAVLPLADERKVLLMSPTCTANELGGKEDQFMRVISPTRVYATKSAHHQFDVQGLRKAGLIYDLRNKAYTESWTADFADAFSGKGGRVLARKGFESGDDAGLAALVESVLQARPDLVVIAANSVDAALLTQLVRRRAPTVGIVAAEWASTERYIELAGKAADGVFMAQFYDRFSGAPGFQSFRTRYRDRFGEEPGFGGVAAYDAATVVFHAIRQQGGKSLREAVLSIRRFDGVQGRIEFDANGNADREVFLTRVQDGRFVLVSGRP